MTSLALWGSDLDSESLPHFIALQDTAFGEGFWKDFPGCARYVMKVYPSDPSISYASVWLAETPSEDAWHEAALTVARPPKPRKSLVGLFKPNLVLEGDGLPPPINLWRAHPAVKRANLYYQPGVPELSRVWHIAGGGDGWRCEIWLKAR